VKNFIYIGLLVLSMGLVGCTSGDKEETGSEDVLPNQNTNTSGVVTPPSSETSSISSSSSSEVSTFYPSSEVNQITLDEAQNGIFDSVNIKDSLNTDDWYELILDKTGTYTLYTTLLEGSVIDQFKEAEFEVIDQYGNVLKKIVQSGTLSAFVNTFETDESGTYYLHVRRQSSLGTKYNFEIQPSVVNGLIQDNDGEYNDVISMATEVTYEALQNGVNGSINITKINDYDDWYKFTLDKTGTYTLYTTLLEGSVIDQFKEAEFEVIDQYGNVLKKIVQSGTLSAFVNTFETDESGTYYLHVRRQSSLDTKYNFEVHSSVTMEEVNIDSEYNDVISMATKLTSEALQNGINGSVNIKKINLNFRT